VKWGLPAGKEVTINRDFRGASLALFDSEAVMSQLDVRLRTPPLLTIEDGPWQSQTLNHTLEFGLQSNVRLRPKANSQENTEACMGLAYIDDRHTVVRGKPCRRRVT
jgi:hypothetical protein